MDDKPPDAIKTNLGLAIQDALKTKLNMRILKNINAGAPHISELTKKLKDKTKKVSSADGRQTKTKSSSSAKRVNEPAKKSSSKIKDRTPRVLGEIDFAP